jgi:hypothetical protein
MGTIVKVTIMNSIVMKDSAQPSAAKPLRVRLKNAGSTAWSVTKTTGRFLWRWLKWPALVLCCLAFIYYVGPILLGWLAAGVGAIFWLLGAVLQLVAAVIGIAILSLSASIQYLFGGGEALYVTYDFWLFATRTDSSLYFGVWALEGTTVYVVGGLTLLALAYYPVATRSRMARVRRQLAEVRSEKCIAEANHSYALAASRQEGHADGIRQEQNRVWPAYIHAYRPKMELPPIPKGLTRFFWIEVCVKKGLQPTQDRTIHWGDYSIGSDGALGAPMYRIVSTPAGECDRLAMLGVVYTLNKQTSAS